MFMQARQPIFFSNVEKQMQCFLLKGSLLVAFWQCISAVCFAKTSHCRGFIFKNLFVCLLYVRMFFLMWCLRGWKSPESYSMHALSGNNFIDLHGGDGGLERCYVAIISTSSGSICCSINAHCKNPDGKLLLILTQCFAHIVSTVRPEIYSIVLCELRL